MYMWTLQKLVVVDYLPDDTRTGWRYARLAYFRFPALSPLLQPPSFAETLVNVFSCFFLLLRCMQHDHGGREARTD